MTRDEGLEPADPCPPDSIKIGEYLRQLDEARSRRQAAEMEYILTGGDLRPPESLPRARSSAGT